MNERKKVEEYRRTLETLARTPNKGKRLPALEGKAAKLGLEIQGEESKAAPRPRGNRFNKPKT